ncbi:MAG: nuclear transport factor 2 family protein, partial [Phycisphaerales bacterium]
GNVGILLSYFTDDAIVLPDQLEAAIGQDALRRHYLQQMEQQVKIRSLKDIESQIWICGDYVFEVGNFVVSITSPELRFMLSDWQKNLAVYKKQPDGSLKMKLTASNPTQIPEDGNIPEAIGPEAVKVISSRRPSNLPLSVSEQIKKDEDIFHNKFLERDAEEAVEFYAEDAVLLRWGEDALKGKSEILKVIKKSLREEPLVDITQKVVHVEGNSQMLFVVNLLTWTFKDASSGENVTLPGKGVHVWRRQKDGSWKILFDLYNVNVPIPGR